MNLRIFLSMLGACGLMSGVAQADTLSGAQYTYTFTPPAGIDAPYFVTQSLSAGQVAQNISAGGVFDAEAPAIKWGPFVDGSAVELSFHIVGSSTTIGALIATDDDSEAPVAATPVSDSADPFLVWVQEQVPARPKPDQALDANLEGDPFPNFAEYLLGFDPMARETIDDALQIVPDGAGGYDIEFNRLGDEQRFQAIIERVDLATGEATPLIAAEIRSGAVAEIVTEVFNESAAPFFVRVLFLPFESAPVVD